MKKNILLGLVIASSTMFTTLASAESVSFIERDAYTVTCTGTDSGYSWIRHTSGLRNALDAAADCINQGGVPTIRSTNLPF